MAGGSESGPDSFETNTRAPAKPRPIAWLTVTILFFELIRQFLGNDDAASSDIIAAKA
mgnify:CR=1 FL=1